MEAEDDDGNLAADVIQDLTRALLACGRVAFRWDEAPPPGKCRRHPAPRLPPAVTLTRAVAGWFAPELVVPVFNVLTTADPSVARWLFLCSGWVWAAQAVLVYDPSPEDPPDVVARLQRGLDWRRESLPASARLLFGPGHDGAFAVAAARSPEDLDDLEAALQRP